MVDLKNYRFALSQNVGGYLCPVLGFGEQSVLWRTMGVPISFNQKADMIKYSMRIQGAGYDSSGDILQAAENDSAGRYSDNGRPGGP